MIPISIQQVKIVTSATVINGTNTLSDQQVSELDINNPPISSVTTDTRTVEKGSLFVALIGERFDAHDFAQQAVESGASALLVSRLIELPPTLASSVIQILVSDTRIAFGQISAWVHQQSTAKTLALTGSCGKTTVKEMLAAILRQKGNVLATQGNFNNDIGVPLTLLQTQVNDDYAVIELGANHLGEIAYTTHLTKPDVALINNVAAAHLEGFGSIEGVAKAKGEIFQGLPENGVAVINLDSCYLDVWQKSLADKKVVTFSVNPLNNADFYAQDTRVNQHGKAQFLLVTPKGSAIVNLPMIGQHNVSNALAATAMAMQVDCDLNTIVSGLEQTSNAKGRVEAMTLTPTIELIDDSYNASVPAMEAAVDLLANYDTNRWLILGFMAELGSESQALHRQIGTHASQYHFDYVLTYGDDTKSISEQYRKLTVEDSKPTNQNTKRTKDCHIQHFDSHEDMICFIMRQLKNQAAEKHTLLVKGANSAKMSRIVTALKETY